MRIPEKLLNHEKRQMALLSCPPGDIRFIMNGGVLDGFIDGVGNIVCPGDTAEEKIRINGLGRVRAELYSIISRGPAGGYLK